MCKGSLNEYDSRTDESKVTIFLLSQRISSGGKTVQEDIQENGKGSWILDVIGEFNNSTVLGEPFERDTDAINGAVKTISDEGIGSLTGPESGK